MQGLVSILIGCHSVIHSILVLKSWIILYKKWPKPWQIICIFLHDIGHIGLNYLDNIESKNKHWILGANIASYLFGLDGYLLIAGHNTHSGYSISELYKADKYSWYIAPYWWLYWNNIVEPKLKCGMKNKEAVIDFMNQVNKSIESGEFIETHKMYTERKEKLENN